MSGFNLAPLPINKIIVGGACVALILIGMSLIPAQQADYERLPLLGDRQFNRAELDELELAFSEAGLKSYERRSGQLWVAPEKRSEFLAVAQKSGALPIDLLEPTTEASSGLELFESSIQQRSRLQSHKALQLGTKLRAFPDVAWASVTYDQQLLGGLQQETIQSASVVIIPSNEKPLSPNRIDMIRQYVAGAYAGMTVEQVTVTDTTAMESYNGKIDETKRAQRHFEYEMEQRLTDLLIGFGNVRVAVMHSPGEPDDPTSVQPRISIALSEAQFHIQWARDFRSLHHDAEAIPWPSKEQLASARDRVIANVNEVLRPLVGSHVDDSRIHICSYPDSIPAEQYATPPHEPFSLANAQSIASNNVPLTASIIGLALITLFCGAAALRMRLRVTDPSIAAKHSIATSKHTSSRPRSENDRQPDATTIREDLTELIEANPELAAQIVHRWMADAA
ncbi:hypothetical protein [Rhodopirellula sp. MGV]|uniref:hypothetical protein n=1 Tax=Rhodopirellula sp. MGV TaxID=2023130 RepID=UPI000B962B75|nr:hypothetical protein [Rhodopirellula sp. MGV]OYP34236.1 hypothetical protein CGZ80_15755 [Rhodopirellula sp. MGV]PNY35019.1 hypothetical protein C2E31_20105 [Rhodopirellula baltica]